MGIFNNIPKSTGGTLVFPPKLGEKLEFIVVGQMERVKSDNPEFNYKASGMKDMGYYDVLPVVVDDQEKKLKISTWAVFTALQNANPDEGDQLVMEHSGTGKYTVTKK